MQNRNHSFRYFTITLLLTFVMSACATSVQYTSKGHSNKPGKFYEGQVLEGFSSYYGKKFNGRKTASGEIFDMYKLSAAHRFLPFGTVVEVVNTENGRSVRLKINDRGPFVGDRILDLSYAAARKLDMIGSGVTYVKVRIIQLGKEVK